jgi:hypothetical protein
MVKYDTDPDATKLLDEHEKKEFRSAVGRLLYLSHTRFDIQYCVRFLCCSLKAPEKRHWLTLKHLTRYLMGTKHMSLLFKQWLHPEEPKKIRCFVDSDWAGSEGRKSTSGGCLTLGGNPISSWSRGQSDVARSSGEAEFHAITLGCEESLHLKYTFEVLGTNLIVEVLSDSSAGRAMCHRIGAGCLKHIQTKFFWVQECLQQGLIKVGAVRGSDNPADLGTKAVTAATLRHLLERCGLVLDSDVTVAATTSTSSASASLGINPTMLSALVLLLQALQAKAHSDEEDTSTSTSTGSVLALLFISHVLGF